MTHLRHRRARSVRVLVASVCAILAVGCSADSDPAPRATEGTHTATTAPDGTTLAGTRLRLGRPALIHWAPDRVHSSTVSVRVTRVRRGTIADLDQFQLPDSVRSSSVYYVSATVTNAGRGDLGGAQVELFGQVSDDLVVQPVDFGSTFARCDLTPLPVRFGPGARARVCAVLLAPKHGRLRAVEWRDGDTDPISWAVR